MITHQMLEDVRTFMTTFGQETQYDEIPDDVLELRKDLIKEEFEELTEALLNLDFVEVADAITDLVYVSLGALIILEVDLPEAPPQIAFTSTEQHAMFLSAFYALLRRLIEEECPLINIQDVIFCINMLSVSCNLPLQELFDEVHASNMSKLGADGKPIYRDDGKVLKGPNYFKPNLARILQEAANDS